MKSILNNLFVFLRRMARTIDKIKQLPYHCSDCKHFISGLRCKAFDEIIPIEIWGDSESHKTVLPGQKGDFVFETDKQRDTMRVYEVVED
ncbi:MAG: hypothetical protein J6V30_06930 [Paludibacteraceae bacterium]|nr:hypothetical protein [Paludibacteraceae bacterium]